MRQLIEPEKGMSVRRRDTRRTVESLTVQYAADRSVRLPDSPNQCKEGLTAVTTDAHKPKAHR